MLAVSVGPFEIMVVVLVILLLFGASQLPKLARSMGQASKEFKQGLAEGLPDDDDKGSKRAKDS